jgi:hypothetical protein
MGSRPLTRVAAELGNLRDAIHAAETSAVETAREKLVGMEAEHAALTRAWVKASEGMQKVLKQDIDRLEADMQTWKPRTVPLSDRLGSLYAAEKERAQQRQKLLAEWPGLEQRERGAALLRLFKRVTLFWSREWHPASANPTRPRKTNRPGRWACTLERDQIKWAFANSELDDRNSPGTCSRSGR